MARPIFFSEYALSLCLSLYLSLSLSLSLSLTHTLSLSLSLSHTHTHTLGCFAVDAFSPICAISALLRGGGAQ